MNEEATKKVQKFNDALSDPHQFKQFARDPAGFAKGFGVKIDPALSSQLASKLHGHASLADLHKATAAGNGNFTAAAAAMGVVSVSDTKLAAVGI
jgi:hypothetical protein